MRTIQTARTKSEINEATKLGFFPLIKRVEASESIKSKYSVLQNKETGEIQVVGDYRISGEHGFETVIGFTYYYPYSFPSPFAAYLLPKDLKIGERVLLGDLIEDCIGTSWNQGDTSRLSSGEAIWNGQDFELQFDPKQSMRRILG